MKCGIVDLGSNTIRLSIYQWEGRQFKLLMNKKEMAGLAGYIQDGVLTDKGIEVACQILAAFRHLLENLEIRKMHVFATASLRNIVNTQEALDAIFSATGLQVQVLSGSQEAELSFLGATVGGGAPATGLLVDIGGGSTELVAYDNGSITSECSLPVGSLSLYSRYVTGLFPTKEQRHAIRRQVEQQLESAKTAGLCCAHLTGVGGTIRAAAKLCRARTGGEQGMEFEAAQLRRLYRELKKGDQDTLRQILRVVPERVHTILPGLMILNSVLKSYQVERVTVSTCGVREGYLLRHVMEVEQDA